MLKSVDFTQNLNKDLLHEDVNFSGAIEKAQN